MRSLLVLLATVSLCFGDGTWTRLNPEGSVGPPGRMVHSSVVHEEDLYVFGGITYDGTNTVGLADLWRYTAGTKKWDEIKSSPGPAQRGYHTATLAGLGSNVTMIVFGGKGEPYEYHNDVWAYDMATRTWTQMQKDSEDPLYPMKRFYHTAEMISPTDMIIFGGYSYLQGPDAIVNDVWQLDVDGNTWTNLVKNGTAGSPPVRQGHSTHFVPGLGMLMWGGAQLDGALNDLWLFTPDVALWSNLQPALSPPARASFGDAGILSIHRWVVYGGTVTQKGKPEEFYNDVWAYDWLANKWEQWGVQDAADAPWKRKGCSCTPVQSHSFNDAFVMFGGYGLYQGYKDDVWEYSNPNASFFT